LNGIFVISRVGEGFVFKEAWNKEAKRLNNKFIQAYKSFAGLEAFIYIKLSL